MLVLGGVRIVALSLTSHEQTQKTPNLLISNIVGFLSISEGSIFPDYIDKQKFLRVKLRIL